MASGPEHFRLAEELLEMARACVEGQEETYYLTAASVHATLALAAATAMQPANYALSRPESTEWFKAAGVEDDGSAFGSDGRRLSDAS